MMKQPEPVSIFFSYAHEDEPLRKELEKHLSLLQRQGLISTWQDRQITAGADWANAVDEQLKSAAVILLLISADFLASDYCYGVEMQCALDRDKAGQAKVIPIALRPCDWKDAPFARLQALPTDARPITKWPDKDDAWADVVAGLRRVIKERAAHAVSGSPAALPSIWNIPHQRNPFFTGREDIIKDLYHSLKSGKTAALVQPRALSGLGGIGKTQTAIQYAYQYYGDYPEAVLWARADSSEVLISDLVAIADLLGLADKNEYQRHVIAAIQYWLREHTHWLFIFDNVEDLEIVKSFIPPLHGGHILITTRLQALGGLARSINIEKMTLETGALFLLRRANFIEPETLLHHTTDANYTTALEISKVMDGLPLALDQAGAYIEETHCSLPGYLNLYHRQRKKLLKRRGIALTGHPESVATTISLSFEKIQQSSPIGAKLLQLCSFLHPDAIPEEIVTIGISEVNPSLRSITDLSELDEAIGELRKFSLIHRDSTTRMLSIHRLVQAILKDEMNEDAQRQQSMWAVQAVNQVFPTAKFKNRFICQRYLPQAQVCAVLIEQWPMDFEEATELLYKAGDHLKQIVQYTEAELFYKQAVTNHERVLGSEHPEVATDLSILADLYSANDKYTQAEPLYQRALDIDERALGPEHPEVAIDLNQLANLYYSQGEYTQAEPLYQRALNIKEQVFGSEHPKVATALCNLADLYVQQGRYTQAEPLYQRALNIKERASLLRSLANLSIQQGRYTQAEALYQRALNIDERAFGPNQSEVVINLTLLANLSVQQGKYPEAEALYERALNIREQSFGSEHPNVATTLCNLADLYVQQGRYTQAEPLYERALNIREQIFGSEHPKVATILCGLADLYRQQGKYTQAEPLYQRALNIREQSFGSEHPDVATTLCNLADLYVQQGRYTQAEALHQRALNIREQIFGSEHPDVATTLSILAKLYYQQGKYAQVEALYQRALNIREQSFGSEHPKVATILCGLADLYRQQGKYTQIEPLYERALRIEEQVFGPEHPKVAVILNNLANIYYAHGKYAQAKLLCERALRIEEQVFGSEHPEVAVTLNNLANIYHRQRNYIQAELLYKRALNIDEKIFGPEHLKVATDLNQLANFYYNQDKYILAESLYKRALSIRTEILGLEHSKTVTILKNLANLYRKQGKYAKAKAIYKGDSR